MNLRQYYKFPKIYVQRLLFFLSGSTSLYFVDRKLNILKRLKTQIVDDAAHSDDIISMNDKINDSYFTELANKRVKDNFSKFLNKFTIDESIEESAKDFVKTMLAEVFLNQELISFTKIKLSEIIKDEFSGEIFNQKKSELSDFINKDNFVKDIVCSDELMTKINSEKLIKNKMLQVKNPKVIANILAEIFDKKEIKKTIVNKINELYTLHQIHEKHFYFDEKVRNTNKELDEIIKNI